MATKAAAKKASAAKKTPSPKTRTEPASGTTRDRTKLGGRSGGEKFLAVTDQVGKLREQGKDWQTIQDTLSISRSTAILADMRSKLTSKQIVKWKSDDELGEAIVTLRNDDNLSWGQISARTGVGEGKIRRIWSAHTKQAHRGNRIGKGGRYPTTDGPDKPVKTRPAPAKKAAKATKASGNGNGSGAASGKLIPDMNFEELMARLNGKKMTVRSGPNKTKAIAVQSVTSLEDGDLHFTDQKGNARTVKVTDIQRATK